jgi:hypothetical protein
MRNFFFKSQMFLGACISFFISKSLFFFKIHTVLTNTTKKLYKGT